MFRHFLTQQFALNFERACQQLELPEKDRHELLRCAHRMIQHFTEGTQAQEPEKACRGFFVALTFLRDCRETVLAAGVDFAPMQGPFEVLEGRLEMLCWQTVKMENGQLRMLG